MSEKPPPKRQLGRRRRANVAGGRKHRHAVLVTPEEEALLVQRAEAQRVTVPRLRPPLRTRSPPLSSPAIVRLRARSRGRSSTA